MKSSSPATGENLVKAPGGGHELDAGDLDRIVLVLGEELVVDDSVVRPQEIFEASTAP
jgi:hypothetical protein